MAFCVCVPRFTATAPRQSPMALIHGLGISRIHTFIAAVSFSRGYFRTFFPVTFQFYHFLGHYIFLGKFFPSASLWAPTESEIPCRLLWPHWDSWAGSIWGSASAAAPTLVFYSSDAHRFTGLVTQLCWHMCSVVSRLCSCPSGLRMLLLRRKVTLGNAIATHHHKAHTAGHHEVF